MVHLWLRAEERPNEDRTGLTPEGASYLIAQGFRITVEENPVRCFPGAAYQAAGCTMAPYASWPTAPDDAIIFGLKELPETDAPLRHRHIMFGHAYKGQVAGQRLLRRFRSGAGVLYDLEALTDASGRRVAAFGYWAGYVGAAVALQAWAAQAQGQLCGPVQRFSDKDTLLSELHAMLGETPRPDVLIIGALGRVGHGAADLCAALDVPATLWDKAETGSGGPFPQVLEHGVFLNCILAMPGCPVFLPANAVALPRALRVVGDIACDPGAEFSPVKVYDQPTDWNEPALRVHDNPILDVVAIDNLPSLLPVEASVDFAAQLLPHLAALTDPNAGVWARAGKLYHTHAKSLA